MNLKGLSASQVEESRKKHGANTLTQIPPDPLSAAPLLEAMDRGTDCLLDIEPQGALQVRANRPDAVLIFLAPPSLPVLESRLRSRGDTAPELVEKRLKQARWELEQAAKYDYIVINDSVEKAAAELLAIMTAEKCRVNDRIQLLKEEK